RKFVRVKFPCEICVDIPQNEVISTHTENISAGGIRVILEQKLQTAAIISLTIYKITENPIICKGRIVWIFTRRHPHNKDASLFDTGIEFCEIADEDISRIKKFVLSVISDQE
ncbi:MAG: PilZ domain-containing protein, partial [Candidatus Omnitrophota bacterium]